LPRLVWQPASAQSAVTAQADRVRSGWRESLFSRIDNQAQGFQCFDTQNRLVNLSNEDGGRRLAAVNLYDCQVGPQSNPSPIGKPDSHEPSRLFDPEGSRKLWRYD
jgi:hypothetical protein